MSKVCDALPPVRGSLTHEAPLKDLVWFRAGGPAGLFSAIIGGWSAGGPREGEDPQQAEEAHAYPSAANTSSAWPSTFTRSQRFCTFPSGPIR